MTATSIANIVTHWSLTLRNLPETEMKSTLAATLLCMLPALASAHDYTSGEIEVHHPYTFESAPTAKTAAGYLSVINHGTAPDVLLGIEADFPKVMMHQSREMDGVATMDHVPALDIPPGATVSFEPGGYHVMFMGLDGAPLADGDSFPATLVFRTAGRIDVEFHVESRDAEAPGGGMADGHAAH